MKVGIINNSGYDKSIFKSSFVPTLQLIHVDIHQNNNLYMELFWRFDLSYYYFSIDVHFVQTNLSIYLHMISAIQLLRIKIIWKGVI